MAATKRQLTLRDLFWLVLVAAVLVAWATSHGQSAVEIKELEKRRPFFGLVRSLQPSFEAKHRAVALKVFGALSDAKLSDLLSKMQDFRRYDRGLEYEPCLTEMARRGMREELQKHYDLLMARERVKDGHPDYPENLELLTALRRAQGEPDPLKIHVELWHKDYSGNPSTIPEIRATIENVDVGKELVYLSEGGDDRSGRRTRWRINLTDRRGRRIPDSNFSSWGDGGGIGSDGLLTYGEKGSWTNRLDVRSHIKPPPPGKYQLQLVHSPHDIAGEPNLDGLIVLKSEPIDVIVEWPDGVEWDHSMLPPIAVLGIVSVACLALATRCLLKAQRAAGRIASLIRRRDVLWLAVVVALAAGWLVDNRYLAFEIARLTPDQEANWTMRLAE